MTPQRNSIPTTTWSEIARLAQDPAQSYQGIADTLGVGVASVAAIASSARRLGLQVPYRRLPSAAISEQTRERVVALATERLPAREVAERVGLRTSTVRRLVRGARDAGAEIPARPLGRRSAARGARSAQRERRQAILALAREGLRDPEIAQRLGLRTRTVSNVVYSARKSGFEIPYRRRGCVAAQSH